MSEPLEPPDCLACGACCFSRLDEYVRVTGDDYARLGADAERLTHFSGTRAFMRMEHGRCAALRVAGGQHFCTVYERRPEICRALERGSPSCEAEREEKAERARAAAR